MAARIVPFGVTPRALALAALFALFPSPARADRVLVLHPEPAPGAATSASPDLLARLEGATIAALVSMSHEPVRDESTSPPADVEVRALGATRSAPFVVRVRATPIAAGYVAHATVYDVRAGTTREGSGEIVPLREVSQLVEVLQPLFVAEAGADSVADAADDSDSAAAADSDTEAGAVAGTVVEAQEAWASRERERQEAVERQAWENRERYGVPGRMLFQGGLALRPITNRPDAVDRVVLGAIELRFGYGFPKAPGLEVRGSLEGSFGALSGFSFMGGAVYLFSPFVDAPVHIGPSLELGWLQAFEDGLHQAFFAFRLSPVVSWRFGDGWYLEGAAPEVMTLVGGSLAATVGLAVRVGRRF